MNLLVSPLSKDAVLISSFSIAKTFFLAARHLTQLHLHSHPQQVTPPPTQLCWYCHLSSFLINLTGKLVQVIFLSTLFFNPCPTTSKELLCWSNWREEFNSCIPTLPPIKSLWKAVLRVFQRFCGWSKIPSIRSAVRKSKEGYHACQIEEIFHMYRSNTVHRVHLAVPDLLN